MGARSQMRERWVEFERYLAPSSSGLGHHPLKVAARVRIPLGLPIAFRYALFLVGERSAVMCGQVYLTHVSTSFVGRVVP